MYGRNKYGRVRYGRKWHVVQFGDRRATQVVANAEYAGATNFDRVTQVIANAEYTGATNFDRVTQVVVLVEYRKPYMRQKVQWIN